MSLRRRSMRRIAVLAIASIKHIFEMHPRVCWNAIDARAIDRTRAIEVHHVHVIVCAIGDDLHREQSIKFDTLPVKSLVAHSHPFRPSPPCYGQIVRLQHCVLPVTRCQQHAVLIQGANKSNPQSHTPHL